MPPPPALPEELVEEIFLRLPPDEPACLLRASLASKSWFGLLTGPRFRGLYRERHGAPPMLGFIYSCHPDYVPDEEDNLPYFVATAKFPLPIPGVEDWKGWHRDYLARDCRHGRVLFSNADSVPMLLVVWDPMTGRRRLLQAPQDYDSSRVAVLCNVTGCDHRACHLGPFQVLFLGLYYTDGGCVAYAYVSLPEVVKWSSPCTIDLAMEDVYILDRPSVFIQDALYFMLTYEFDNDDGGHKTAILKYDLSSNCLSLIDAPPVKTGLADDIALMAMEDGTLGFAHMDGLTLNLWSRRHMDPNGVVSWTRRKVINLETLLPIQNPKENLKLVGSVEGSDIIFVTADLGIYEINLRSLLWKKIWRREKCHALFPYTSFYNQPEWVGLSDAAL